MAQSLRIKEKLCNTPHLISPASFDTIISYLESRENGNIDKRMDGGNEVDQASYSYSENGVGFIEINGALTYKPTGMEMLCGGTSYMSILEAMHERVEEECHTVVLSIDSGGGEAYSMIQTATELRQMADAEGIKLLAYVDGMAASAAYGLACSAHEIILNPDAEVGSVGVVVRLMNDSEHLKQEGYERSFVYAGKNKIPYAADGSFRKEFLDDIQYRVDAMYEQFTGFVAEYRNIPLPTVVDTQASVYMAKDAVELGMADSIKTREQFFNYLADISEEQKYKGGAMLPKLFNMSNQKKEKAEMAEFEALQAKLAEFETAQIAMAEKVAAYEASLTDLTAKFEAVTQERDAAKAALQQKEQAEAQAAQAAAEAKEKARMDALKEAVGDVEAEAAFADIKELSDEAFSRTVARMAAAVDKTNDALGDKGYTVEQKEADVVVDPTARILQEKYHKKEVK